MNTVCKLIKDHQVMEQRLLKGCSPPFSICGGPVKFSDHDTQKLRILCENAKQYDLYIKIVSASSISPNKKLNKLHKRVNRWYWEILTPCQQCLNHIGPYPEIP